MARESLLSMRERFHQAERRGWFFSGSTVTKYPLSSTGVALEGKPPRKQSGEQNYGKAAVLFLIGCKERSHQPQVLITKRSTNVGSHPGEYCLPGGMCDTKVDKSPADTALREAAEEVGLDSCHVEVLCTLPPFLSGWLHTIAVAPVVALLHTDIEQLELHENHEVEHSLWVPLEHFVLSDYHAELHGLWRGLLHTINAFHLREPEGGAPCVIWGLTAAMCIAVSSIALGKSPHYPSYCAAICKISDTHVYVPELASTSRIANILHTSKL